MALAAPLVAVAPAAAQASTAALHKARSAVVRIHLPRRRLNLAAPPLSAAAAPAVEIRPKDEWFSTDGVSVGLAKVNYRGRF
jgi:hypothetical protein